MILCLLTAPNTQQTIVTGILELDGERLPGIKVLVVGSRIESYTNIDGEFELKWNGVSFDVQKDHWVTFEV